MSTNEYNYLSDWLNQHEQRINDLEKVTHQEKPNQITTPHSARYITNNKHHLHKIINHLLNNNCPLQIEPLPEKQYSITVNKNQFTHLINAANHAETT